MRKFNQNLKERGFISDCSDPAAIWPVADKNSNNHKKIVF